VLAAVLFLGLKLFESCIGLEDFSEFIFTIQCVETVLSVFVTIPHPAPSFYM
jgi:hypothetical protein